MSYTLDSGSPLEESPRAIDLASWSRRHQALMLVMLMQALVLLGWAAATDDSARLLAAFLIPIMACAAFASSARPQRCARSAALAVGLMTESLLLVVLTDGSSLTHYHFVLMLIAVAVYEDPRPLLAGALLAVTLNGLGVLLPDGWFTGSDTAGLSAVGFAGLHIAFLMTTTVALMATWRSNTVVRASERSQRLRAEQYLDIAESLVLVTDAAGSIIVANRAACLLLGRPEDELLGSSWIEIMGNRSQREETVASLESALQADGSTLRHESEIFRPDGECRLVAWRGSILRDAQGGFAGLIASGLDVTEQRASEQLIARDRRDLTLLRRLAHAVASVDDARQEVVDGVVAVTDACFGALLEADESGDRLQVSATTLDALADRQVLLGREVSGAATALLSGEPYFVSDVRGHPGVSSRLQAATSAVSVIYQPVMVGTKAVAVLVVGWTTRIESLGSRETDLVGLASDEASAALQRVGQLNELRRAALVDPLTGVPNRRAFELELAGSLERARETGRPISLLLLDLNRFKALNDSQGHEAGDRLLKAAASAWSAELRPGDLLARLGGDEFVIVLPSCSSEDAALVAGRVRAATPHEPGCAIGVVTGDGHEAPGALLRRADEALYADKARSGSPQLANPTRLRALEATGLLDAPPEERFDRLTQLAAWVLDVPVALLTLVTDERQFFLSNCGLDGYTETPLTHSFCQHPVASGRPLIVEDARENPLLAGNLAVRDLSVVAYAGIPLSDGDGNLIGVLCAIDTKPRAWSADDLACLRRIAERSAEELSRPALTQPSPS